MKLQVLSAARDRLATGPFLSAKAEARINTATELIVELPIPAEPGAGLSPYEAARLGAFLELLDDAGNLLASGVVTSRRVGPDSVSVTALTEEVLLEAHTLPRGYAACLVGLPITELARALLWGREVVQITTQAEWEAGTLTGLDTTTEPGVVMLAKDGSGAYLSEGTGRWTLTSSGVTGWQAWERLRWLADHDEVVSTELRYRKPGGSWSPWASGGLPAEVGVEVVGDAAVSPTLEVEVRLTTTDTTSPDPNDDPVGVTPYLFALEAVARTEPLVTEGSIPATEPEVPVVYGLDTEADNALKVLSEACEAVGWEFRVRRGELDVAEELGDDRTDTVLLREGTNLRLSELGEDDSEWANVVTAYGPGDGIDALTVTRRHAESIADHGVERRRVLEFPTAVDRADLIAQADAWLAEHAYPASRFAGEAAYEAGTEPLIRLGDAVRVAVPSSGLIRTVRVTELTREERAAEARLYLTLGTPERGLLEAITEPAKEAQRRLDRRPLGPPVGFRLAAGSPGLRVLLNPYAAGSSAGSELRYSTVQGFDPDSEGVRVDLGRSTRATIPNATPGVRYYARARAYDANGRRSEWTEEASAVAGGVVAVPPDGSITIAKLAAGLEPIRIVASLPLVPDPAYTVGESLVLLVTGAPDSKRRLYRLVSETGTPSVDWRPVVADSDLTIDAGAIYADGVFVGTIQAGAIGAEEIAAGSIRAEHLQLTGASYHVSSENDHVIAFEGSMATSKGVAPVDPGSAAIIRAPAMFGRSLLVAGAPVVYPMGAPPEWTLAAYVAKLRTWNDLDGPTWADL
ncbi:MAG TPA: phage tail protein [Longimicrobiales bacterium]